MGERCIENGRCLFQGWVGGGPWNFTLRSHGSLSPALGNRLGDGLGLRRQSRRDKRNPLFKVVANPM